MVTGVAALPFGRRSVAGAASQPLVIHPREEWGADLPPTGPLEIEARGDTRFLLVHHTASANDYGPDEVPGLIRSFYRTHTTTKGWPDVAYNFFVDRHGGTWEGRSGSLEQPVKGSATGGSQGFALLCCLIGNHDQAPPTPEAEAAMVSLLAALATRYGIDPTGSTTFVSRGSNRHPAGSTVTTPTITGHRSMSQTVCPGQFGLELVDRLPPQVAAAMGGAGSPVGPVDRPAPVLVEPTEALPAGPASADVAATPGAGVDVADGAGASSGAAQPAPTAGAPVNRPGRLVPPPIGSKPTVPVDADGPRLFAAGLLGVVGAATAAVISRRGLR